MKRFLLGLLKWTGIVVGASILGLSLGVILVVLSSTAPTPTPTPTPVPPVYVVQHPPRHSVLFVIGADSLAHGCPITTPTGDYVLSSRHVVMNEKKDRLMGARWGEQGGASGELFPIAISDRADIGMFGFVDEKRPSVMHHLSESAPGEGEVLWMFGYNWATFSEKPLALATVRVLAGHIVGNNSAGPGSSGSCLLDERGDVVGVNSWQVSGEGGENLSLGPAVFGPWKPTYQAQ